MANPQNLKPQAHKLTLEEQSAGGKKSAEVRKAKKTIRTILEDFLESDCKDTPLFNKLAQKMGIQGDESVKRLFTMACVLNSLKRGDLGDLGLMQELLCEGKNAGVDVEIEDDPLTKALKEEAEKMNNANK